MPYFKVISINFYALMCVIFCIFYAYKWEKENYCGMFEIQKSGDKTSSGEFGLDIRTHGSPKVGQDRVSGGVSVLCWHAAPVAYVRICLHRFETQVH